MACACLCILSACSAGTDSGSPGPDASEAASSGPGQVGSTEVPEVATAPTTKGAAAFVEHWAQALTRASNTGDTDPWRELNEADCDACANLAEGIDDLYEAGGSLTSEGWQVLDVSVRLRPAGSSVGEVTGATVRLEVDRTPEAVRQDAGSQAEVFRGGRQRYLVHLVRVEDHWSVRTLRSARPEASRD